MYSTCLNTNERNNSTCLDCVVVKTNKARTKALQHAAGHQDLLDKCFATPSPSFLQSVYFGQSVCAVSNCIFSEFLRHQK